jgi:hypothetical protein
VSRVSCIEHPARDPFVLLRQTYMQLVDDDAAAAMLLSAFEQWTNSRLNNAEERGGDLWIFRTIDQLIADDLCGAFGRDRVGKGLQRLIDAGYIERRRNPVKGWDRTWQYRLDIVAVQSAVDGLNSQSLESAVDAAVSAEPGLFMQSPISADASSETRPSNSGDPTSNTTDSEQTPSTPASPLKGATKQARASRARKGSKRKRDQEALAEAEAEHTAAFLEAVELTPAATDGWQLVIEALETNVTPSTFALWFRPLELVGEVAGQLVIAARPEIRAWVDRRYLDRLNVIVREVSEYGGVCFVDVPQEEAVAA